MAEVFAGHSVGDHGFQKPVAIKRLLPELANDEVFVERLIEEAKLLVGMQHGNIVSVLDLAREGDDVFLVMEFVDGPSLRQLIKARGSRGLSLGVATYIVQSAAAGLEFAHVRPGGAIIHADISPSNLLLTTSGEVRVADFGIARREGLGQGVVEGKWAYMAPEQARGESLAPRSDVFALGVVMYELLTGQHPFGRAVTANQRDDQMRVIPPRVVKPTIPHGLDAICMRALAHDARDRYGRMQQLIDALVEERFANGYREGASDLAQAIREVAPKADAVVGPRTMHTERPVTIVTRSLLPADIAPPRRPSNPPSHTPSNPPSHTPSNTASPRTPSHTPQYPLGPLDPPPRDAFPMQPTVGVQTKARLAEPLPQLLPPEDQFPQLRISAAHTTARVVDQVALAQAANAAAAMLQLPGILRADGTPMPPFRLSEAALPGDELASVIGGHTMTGHGASVAVDVRGHRWTIAVLAAATLLGVIAAVAIQLTPDRIVEPAPVRPPAVAPANNPIDETPTRTPEAPVEVRQPARPIQPTIQDPPPPANPANPAAQDTAPTNPAPAAQDTAPTNPAAAAQDTAPTNPAPANPAPAAQDTAPAAAAAGAAPASQNAAPAVPDPAAANDAPKPVDPISRSGDARPRLRKPPVRDAGKRKAVPGILSVQSVPWSWVTVGDQTKETPGAKFYLAPGTYQVTFHNEANGLVKVEHVTIESDKMTKLNEQMDK
jgi:serine/threonine protein kinase